MSSKTQKIPTTESESIAEKPETPKRHTNIQKQNEVVYVDGFDGALIGHGHQQGSPDVLAVYSIPKAVALYMSEKNLTEQEAQQELITKYINTKFAHRCPLWIVLED